jgi:hypothetical protein
VRLPADVVWTRVWITRAQSHIWASRSVGVRLAELVACHFGGRAELWGPFHAAVAQLGAAAPTVVRLLAQSYADPVSVPAPGLSEVDQAVANLVQGDPDPSRTVRISVAAFYVDRLPGCWEPCGGSFAKAGVGARPGPP